MAKDKALNQETGETLMSGKFLARLLAISFALSLGACGGGGSSDDDGSLGGPNTGGDSGGEDTPAEDGQEASVAMGRDEGSSFIEGQIEAEVTELAARGQTTLRVSIVDALNGNTLITGQQVEVNFTSGCATNGSAIINTPIITTSGVAETVYTAAGCAPQDTVTATIADEQAAAQVVLSIDSPDADRILSNEPEPNSIAPEGTGTTARPSESLVTFNVVDKNGDAVRDTEVSFRISGDVPGAETPVSLEPAETVSGPNGTASTLVIAGSESTVVRVIASIRNAAGQVKESQSPPIAINAMLPVQSGFTIAAENFLPDAQFIAGVTVPISVFATDRNGQDIRGGTIINFQTDGGSITPECELTENGTCTVNWRSQAPWLNEPTITATTIGERRSGVVGTISESLRLLVSSSRNPEIKLEERDGNYCATVTVEDKEGNPIHPPEGTTVEFTIEDGEILSSESTYTVRGIPRPEKNEFEECISAKVDEDETENEADPDDEEKTKTATLTGTVRTPGGTVDDERLEIKAE